MGIDPGTALGVGRTAHGFGRWLWLEWRENEDMRDIIHRTLCLAICEDDPDAREVDGLATSVEVRLWPAEGKKGSALLRPVRASTQLVARKWSRRSKSSSIAWPGWRDHLEKLVSRAVEDLGGLPPHPSNGHCRNWPSDATTLAKRVPESLYSELQEQDRANEYRWTLLGRLKTADEIDEHFVRRSGLSGGSEVKFGTTTALVIAAAVAVVTFSQLPQLPNAALTSGALVGIIVLVVAIGAAVFLTVLHINRIRRHKALNRRFTRRWVARYLTVITGQRWEPDVQQLRSGLEQAFQAARLSSDVDGVERPARAVEGSAVASLERDLKERLLPRTASVNDDQLSVPLLELEDALICSDGDHVSGSVLGALAGLIAVTAEGDEDGHETWSEPSAAQASREPLTGGPS